MFHWKQLIEIDFAVMCRVELVFMYRTEMCQIDD